ncbi:MAG TPA: MFS transporter [Methylomirabilota bacterium]|jgi:MFS family permease|nr:MFS transporter [Methylomirabilota bacterium]
MLAPRWRVVVALFVVTSCIASAVSTFGVFLPVLAERFTWSRGAISVALSINLVVGGLAAFAVGRFADRRGPRWALAVTVLVGALGFALSSRVTALWQFYLSYGVLVGVGMSSIYVLTAATVARWFHRRRGLALAIVLSGFNLGWLTGGPLAALLIGRWDWRVAYVVLGALVAAVGIPASLCVSYPRAVRSAPAAGPPAAARWPAADPRLWYLATAWAFLGLVFMMVTVHSVSYARDRGLSLEQASLALSAFGLGAISGRLLAGAAADRFGAVATMRVCLLVQGSALVTLLLGLPPWTLMGTLLVFGLGASGADNTFVKSVPDVFGVAALATVMSVVGLGWRSGAGLGPALAGFVHDATGSYTPSFTFAVVALIVGWTFFRRASAPRLR